MSVSKRLYYFFSPPPLWIVQVGSDELIFSKVTKQGIGDQERLYLESNTTLPNKIANPSSLAHGIKLFCNQKKLTRFRAWFLLPKDCFPLPLLAHELLQFLLSIKSVPVIPEAVITNPFNKPTNLNAAAIKTITSARNHLTIFERYNKLHPAWWGIGLIILLAMTVAVFSRIYAPFSKSLEQPMQKIFPIAQPEPSRQLPKKPSAPKKSPPSLAESSTILTSIATIIPPSIVLNKLALEKNSKTHNKSPITVLAGTTCDLQDLLSFVTLLEHQTNKRCNLSYIKELAPPVPVATPTQFAFYNFSLSIE